MQHETKLHDIEFVGIGGDKKVVNKLLIEINKGCKQTMSK